jgi:peptidyl-prolyl cis-trans isomerase C
VNWRGWLGEPLVHFLFGGALVFAFFAWRGEAVDPESRSIIVTVDTAGQLAARFEQTMQRAPTPAEMDGMIRDYIREEVYYREAIRLGLDADDSVIRRRLRSKMEYLARAQAEAAVPRDAELQAWLDMNPPRYAADGQYSFDQIFLGIGPEEEEPTIVKLRFGNDWQALGKPITLPKRIERAGLVEVERQFGSQFAGALVKLKKDEWSQAIQSGFGYHLVRVREVSAATQPKLADVRQRVENDWRAATAKAREAKAYQLLLDGYDIKIEKP